MSHRQGARAWPAALLPLQDRALAAPLDLQPSLDVLGPQHRATLCRPRVQRHWLGAH